MGRARGSGEGMLPNGAPGTGSQVPGGPMSPLPERINTGSVGALNLLSDPRGVRFGTGHYSVCLQHWVALGCCQQWRHGKSVQFAPVWSAVLSLPTPPYDPMAHHTYEGLVPESRTGRGLAAVTRTPPPRRPTPPPPPTPPIQWRPRALPRASGRQWGCCMRWGAQNFKRYVCMCVFLRLFKFLDASFKSFGFIFKISIAASKIKN